MGNLLKLSFLGKVLAWLSEQIAFLSLLKIDKFVKT